MVDMLHTTHKSIATWILKTDFEQLQQLAAKNNVTIAAYLRAIIVDALQDEAELLQNNAARLSSTNCNCSEQV